MPVNGMIQLIGTQQATWNVQFAVSASAANGTPFTGTIYTIAGQPGLTSISVPASYRYDIVGAWVSGLSNGWDAQLVFNVNSVQQQIAIQLSQVEAGTYHIFQLKQSIPLMPLSVFSILAIQTSAASAAYTQVVYLDVLITAA